MKQILVISPHPDDESIGCGGTLRKHVVDGDVVHAIFLTSGEQGGHGRPATETATLREEEAGKAAEILGLARLDFWRQPDGNLTVTNELVSRLAAVIISRKPDIIYVTHDEEMHNDHQQAASVVQQALLAGPSETARPEVWMYEVWTPLQHFDQCIDITDYLDHKLAAVRAHRSQCAVMRFDEACQGLARYRGEMHSWPSGDYAEVFRVWEGPTGRTIHSD